MLYTKLYKFVWNIMSNNSSTEYHTDLRIRQCPYLFMVYNVSIFLTSFIEWLSIFILIETVKTSNKLSFVCYFCWRMRLLVPIQI